MDSIAGQPPSDLFLRVTPPKVPGSLIARKNLDPLTNSLNVRCIQVSAPAGFGKTSLLGSWRRILLGGGYVVGWVAVQPNEGSQHFVSTLILSVRTASARPSFGATIAIGQQTTGLEAITSWLAEVAQLAIPLAIVIDDIDRLSVDALRLLNYAIRNAPANLRFILACRLETNLDLKEALAYGDAAVIGQSALRFKLPDVIEFLNVRYKGAANADVAARVHELTDGWPLGLQLLVSAADHSGSDPVEHLSRLTRNSSAIRLDWMDLMLSNLKPEDVRFLESISILQDFNAPLCAAVAEDPDAGVRLERLQYETPVVISAEQGTWMRLHTFARRELLKRLGADSTVNQSMLHLRACKWFAKNGLPEIAAFHALEAGDTEQAYELAEQSLYNALLTKGDLASLMSLLERMPKERLANSPRLSVTVAWLLAVSDRHEEAKAWIDSILAKSELPGSLQCEAALILAGAAVFADDPDTFVALHDPWAENPPLTDPLLLRIHANRSCYRSLISGNPALARIRHQQALQAIEHGEAMHLSTWGELIVGLTYLWEGQVQLLDSCLQAVLARAEIDMGRRHVLPCMLASFLATAKWEMGAMVDASALLANRMDVLEQRGLPESVLLAYCTLARIVLYQKQEHRAMEFLDALYAIGQSRNLPRLCVASMVEQIRLHARAYRSQTCDTLYAQLEVLIDKLDTADKPTWAEAIQILKSTGLAYTHVAGKKWRHAATEFQRIGANATRLKMGRLRIEALGMQAFSLDKCGERSGQMMC